MRACGRHGLLYLESSHMVSNTSWGASSAVNQLFCKGMCTFMSFCTRAVCVSLAC